MLIEKVFTDTLNIRDPEDYCADPQAFILKYLRQRYVGRCWGGSYVVSIIKILRRSDCLIKSTDLSAGGTVDVEFLTQASIRGQWDIISGVKIAGLNPIVGLSEKEGVTVVSLTPTTQVETVSEKQIVSVRILRIQYTPSQIQASAVGSLLTCDRAAPTYQLTGNFTKSEAETLRPLTAYIENAMKRRAVLFEKRAADVMFFETLLYSYAAKGSKEGQTVKTSGFPDWSGPSFQAPLKIGTSVTNLLTLVSEAVKKDVDVSGYWARDLSLYRSAPLVAKRTTDLEGWETAVKVSPGQAFALMLKTVYNFLTAVNEMVEIYNSVELINAHKNVWTVMRQTQLPLP